VELVSLLAHKFAVPPCLYHRLFETKKLGVFVSFDSITLTNLTCKQRILLYRQNVLQNMVLLYKLVKKLDNVTKSKFHNALTRKFDWIIT